MRDLAGSWTYVSPDTGDDVTLLLRPDGTFEQVVTLPAEQLTQNGTWTIEGSDIHLEGVLVNFNSWTAETEVWRIIDREESPTGFAILGGGIDPDGWVILRFAR